jgi:hypothetical protein
MCCQEGHPDGSAGVNQAAAFVSTCPVQPAFSSCVKAMECAWRLYTHLEAHVDAQSTQSVESIVIAFVETETAASAAAGFF